MFSLVEDGGFLCRVEAEEPFLFFLFRGGVYELGDACHGYSAMRYLLLDGVVNVIRGGRGLVLVVEDQRQAISESGLGLKRRDARHPLFDKWVAEYLVAFELIPDLKGPGAILLKCEVGPKSG